MYVWESRCETCIPYTNWLEHKVDVSKIICLFSSLKAPVLLFVLIVKRDTLLCLASLRQKIWGVLLEMTHFPRVCLPEGLVL